MDKYNIKFYSGIKKIVNVPMKLFFDISVDGLDNIPKDNYVLIGNHKSLLDLPLLVTSIPDNVHFMAKKELFENKLLNYFFSRMGAFPVDRDKPEMSSIRTAMGLLKEGEVLGIFPEGTRNKTDEILLPFKRGASLIAAKSNKLVVPFGISGEYKPFHKLNLNIGEPFDLSKIDREQQTSYMEEKVKKLIRR